MDQSRASPIELHYARLHDEDLERLDAEKASLTDEAQVALRAEIAKRGISVVRMRESNKVEDLVREATVVERQERRHGREARLVKWMFVLAVPVTVLNLVFNPNGAGEAFFEAMIQCLAIAVILAIAGAIKRVWRGGSAKSQR